MAAKKQPSSPEPKGKAPPKVRASTGRQTPQKEARSRPKPAPKGKATAPGPRFAIVGIGASAGGLEALEAFFDHMPVDADVAFVIIQHMAPGHKSIMDALLQKHTKMEVRVIEDGMKAAANHIYLNPPGRIVDLIGGVFQLNTALPGPVKLPIDHFFRSLADDQAEGAVGVILSGTGTDGTLGVKAIKGGGGITMAQSEAQAKYASMPRSAIDSGMVDMVLDAEKMPESLVKCLAHPYMERRGRKSTADQEQKSLLPRIFLLVRTRTGHDFTHYKQSTIQRRIERRMAMHQIERVGRYATYLQQHPEEVDALFKDMLIGVTSFFRDPEAFEAVGKEVIPRLMEGRPANSTLRVWVPGCATGEEAYSLSILFAEQFEQANKHLSLQIFATDIDAHAIDCARSGAYPESIAADISPDRLTRFFTKEESTLRVKKQIREPIVFALQNVLKDPPFSKLDLISCRNLLIYLDASLQKLLLPLFYNTLNPRGVLFLGPSESIGSCSDLFSQIDKKWKLFRRKGAAGSRADSPGIRHFAPALHLAEERALPSPRAKLRTLAERIVLEEHTPAYVLVDGKCDVLYFHGKTDRFLRQPPGEPTFNLLKLARSELRANLSAAMQSVTAGKTVVITRGLTSRHDGETFRFDLIVRSLPSADGPLLMVLFETRPSHERDGQGTKGRKGAKRPASDNLRVQALEDELRSAKENLQTIVHELETSNEELKSTNEELQSANEELQSANEEMETSKEELQSTNEELETVNSELQGKIDELSRSNDDLNNLLASTQIATVFLGPDLRIKRFTPKMKQLFNLINTDVGRPIGDITSKLFYKNLDKDAAQVLATLNMKEIELSTRDGSWFQMRILPYRTVDNLIDGVVIAFINITDLKRIQQSYEESREKLKSVGSYTRLATVMIDSPDAVAVWDLNGTISEWNSGAEKLYGYEEREARQMNISKLVPEDLRAAHLDLLRRIAAGERLGSLETRRLTRDGRQVCVSLTFTPICDAAGNVKAVATTERDITAKVRIEEEREKKIRALESRIKKLLGERK